MRLDWLEDIVAVADTGSLSEAAEQRHLTQSAFSRRLQTIEDHLGVALFDRSRKPIRLRAPAMDRRDEMMALATQLRQLVEDLRREDRSATNRIVVASQHALTTSLTPSLVREMGQGLADIFVRLRSANLDDCYAQLLSRKSDIALVYRCSDAVSEQERGFDRYLEQEVIGEERLIPVASQRADHVPAAIISYPGDVFLGRLMDRLILPRLRAQGPAVSKVETALTLAALELARQGVGVAWVPRSIAVDSVARGDLVDLSDTLPICRLDIMAFRLAGDMGSAQAAVWAWLSERARE